MNFTFPHTISLLNNVLLRRTCVFLVKLFIFRMEKVAILNDEVSLKKMFISGPQSASFFFQSKPVGTLISTLIMFDMISIQFVFVILFFIFI